MASESRKHGMFHYLRENQEKIFSNNRKWVASKEEEDSEFFVKLSSGQHPEYL
jgi:carbonic anhydrase